MQIIRTKALEHATIKKILQSQMERVVKEFAKIPRTLENNYTRRNVDNCMILAYLGLILSIAPSKTKYKEYYDHGMSLYGLLMGIRRAERDPVPSPKTIHKEITVMSALKPRYLMVSRSKPEFQGIVVDGHVNVEEWEDTLERIVDNLPLQAGQFDRLIKAAIVEPGDNAIQEAQNCYMRVRNSRVKWDAAVTAESFIKGSNKYAKTWYEMHIGRLVQHLDMLARLRDIIQTNLIVEVESNAHSTYKTNPTSFGKSAAILLKVIKEVMIMVIPYAERHYEYDITEVKTEYFSLTLKDSLVTLLKDSTKLTGLVKNSSLTRQLKLLEDLLKMKLEVQERLRKQDNTKTKDNTKTNTKATKKKGNTDKKHKNKVITEMHDVFIGALNLVKQVHDHKSTYEKAYKLCGLIPEAYPILAKLEPKKK